MTLSKSMAQDPGLSEVSVFQSLVTKMMSLHKQLYTQYHTDTLLSDRLVKAVDIPEIHTTLLDGLPRASHQAVNRIANQLSNNETPAGSRYACFLQEKKTKMKKILWYITIKKRRYGEDTWRTVMRPRKIGQKRRNKGE